MNPNITGQLTFGFDVATNLFDYLDKWSHDDGFEPVPATDYTHHEPGSAEKVEVLAQRVLNNESLWHDDDKSISAETLRMMELMDIVQTPDSL